MPPIIDQTGSTYNRGDFTDTNAFLWSSLDLSPYAGTDLGSTPYYIELLDGAGKKATGYIGAVGAGETLGSELNPSWNNGGYDTFVGNTKDITSAIKLTDVYSSASMTDTPLIGWLIKHVLTPTVTVGQMPKYVSYDGVSFVDLGPLSVGTNTFYKTRRATGGLGSAHPYTDSITNYSIVSDLKRVTDPPATAVHIVSSLNGTTRNWASIESGFDPNTITSWGIYASDTLLSPSVSPSSSPSLSPSKQPIVTGSFIIFRRRRRR